MFSLGFLGCCFVLNCGVYLEWGGEGFIVLVFFSYKEILDRKSMASSAAP